MEVTPEKYIGKESCVKYFLDTHRLTIVDDNQSPE